MRNVSERRAPFSPAKNDVRDVHDEIEIGARALPRSLVFFATCILGKPETADRYLTVLAHNVSHFVVLLETGRARQLRQQMTRAPP